MTELKTPILGILGTFYSQSGTVLGPVEPASIEFAAADDDEHSFNVIIRFEAHWPGPGKITIKSGTITIVDSVRSIDIQPGSLYEGDGLSCEYTMMMGYPGGPAAKSRRRWPF